MVGGGRQLLKLQEMARRREEFANELGAVICQYIVRDIIRKYRIVEDYCCKMRRYSSPVGIAEVSLE